MSRYIYITLCTVLKVVLLAVCLILVSCFTDVSTQKSEVMCLSKKSVDFQQTVAFYSRRQTSFYLTHTFDTYPACSDDKQKEINTSRQRLLTHQHTDELQLLIAWNPQRPYIITTRSGPCLHFYVIKSEAWHDEEHFDILGSSNSVNRHMFNKQTLTAKYSLYQNSDIIYNVPHEIHRRDQVII